MSPRPGPGFLGGVREILAATRGQPLPSVVTALVAAGMVTAVLLTAGRATAAQQAVVARIDQVGSRTITVTAIADGATLRPTLVTTLQTTTGVTDVLGLGAPVDATTTARVLGTPIPVRTAWGRVGRTDLATWRHSWDTTWGDKPALLPALATPQAAQAAGLIDGVGPLRTRAGRQVSVVGQLPAPGLDQLEPLVLQPQDRTSGTDRLQVLVVVADRPANVAAVAAIVTGLLAGQPPQAISVATPQALADLSVAVTTDLDNYSRAAALLTLAAGLIVEALVVLAWVASRRRDIGRRRALGASRTVVAALLLGQVWLAAAIGTLLGAAAGLIIVHGTEAAGVPVPFTAAICILTATTAALGALAPLTAAVRRDPVRVLRTP